MATSNREITVDPLDYQARGFKLEELFLKDFVTELKKEFPDAQIGHIVIFLEESKEIIAISHPRREGKVISEYVDIEGADKGLTARTVEVLKRVLS